ncbi:MAG: PIG-L family deacetylase [Chloroflexi bacterium]|nr:PIG-L family deacetylase [Chloroflexota bacterium]
MRTHYHALYLAPHLDDAALSCGGQIYEKTAAGQQVLIVTIMAGDPPAETPHSDFIRELHGRWQLPAGAEAIRRQEDEVACRLLGADFCHWSAPDCIYRTHPVTGELLYPAWADVIGGVHEAEADFIKELAAQMATLPTADMVVAPWAQATMPIISLPGRRRRSVLGRLCGIMRTSPMCERRGH